MSGIEQLFPAVFAAAGSTLEDKDDVHGIIWCMPALHNREMGVWVNAPSTSKTRSLPPATRYEVCVSGWQPPTNGRWMRGGDCAIDLADSVAATQGVVCQFISGVSVTMYGRT
jgi:hypothetical protein